MHLTAWQLNLVLSFTKSLQVSVFVYIFRTDIYYSYVMSEEIDNVNVFCIYVKEIYVHTPNHPLFFVSLPHIVPPKRLEVLWKLDGCWSALSLR